MAGGNHALDPEGLVLLVDDGFVVVDGVACGLLVLARGLPGCRDDQFGNIVLLFD